MPILFVSCSLLAYLLVDGILLTCRQDACLLSDVLFLPASWAQGSKGGQAGNEAELGEFYEATERWLAFYEQARALAARKQAELASSAVSRGMYRQQAVFSHFSPRHGDIPSTTAKNARNEEVRLGSTQLHTK